MSWFDDNRPGPTPIATVPSNTPTTSTPSASGDPQQVFMSIMQGLPATPANLAAKEQELAQHGIFVHRNAEGVAGKVQLGQGGPIIDVIANSGAGGGGQWQWVGPGSEGGMGGFQTGVFTGGGQYPLASVMGTGLGMPWTTPFVAPNNLTEQNDPGFQARLKMGTDALQRSAAARGTLLTGGLLKSLDRYAQDYASNEYNNVYNRALGEYQQAYNIFEGNQGNLFNRLSSLSSIGENAAAGVGNAQIGMGNANAAGSINQGNIAGNTINNAGNSIGQFLYLNSLLHQQQPTSSYGTTFPTNSAP